MKNDDTEFTPAELEQQKCPYCHVSPQGHIEEMINVRMDDVKARVQVWPPKLLLFDKIGYIDAFPIKNSPECGRDLYGGHREDADEQ